jgi:hypothetical protein
MIEKVGLIKDGVLTRLIFRHTIVGRQQHQKWILVPAASVASALIDHAVPLRSAIVKISGNNASGRGEEISLV